MGETAGFKVGVERGYFSENIFPKPYCLYSLCFPIPYVDYVYETVSSKEDIAADIMQKLYFILELDI
jgi:hypothetical protein